MTHSSCLPRSVDQRNINRNYRSQRKVERDGRSVGSVGRLVGLLVGVVGLFIDKNRTMLPVFCKVICEFTDGDLVHFEDPNHDLLDCCG